MAELQEPVDPGVVYESPFRPDPASARDVLAFVLTPATAFRAEDAEDGAMADEIMMHAKQEAVDRWLVLYRKACSAASKLKAGSQ
jgi:hypothetical protein